MSAPLEVRDLRLVRQSRGGRFELRVESLDITPGEVLAVLGPNGAGKSTLLRALADLEPIREGVIRRHATGPVTMVFQRPIAFAGTVAHNACVALRARGVSAADAARRGRAALSHFGIEALAARRATALSGGELRRLALARAFAIEPAVLLLDEPFDDLDAEAREALSRDLRAAVAKTGVAVALVTHDLRRAALVCDRIAVLVSGELRQQGAREAVMHRPRDPEIARLVGMTNLLAARLEQGGLAVLDSERRIPTRSALPAGSPVWLGLRPEHLKLDIGRGEGETIGDGHVLEHTSDGVLATLRIAWGEDELRTHMVAGRGLDRELGAGDTVSLAVRPGDVHVMPRPLP